MITSKTKLQRLAIIAIAAFVTGVMGIKSPRGRAGPFAEVEMTGLGRATLDVQPIAADAEGPAPPKFEVFARAVYATELSSFGRGLYIRSSFTMPGSGQTGVFIIDVDRARDRTEWAFDDRGLKARFYTLASRDARAPDFDGIATSGGADLEASAVGNGRAGFRLVGSLRFGDDNTAGGFEIDFELESVPPPEQIEGRPSRPPHEPTGGICDPTWCWEDDGYYDTYWYGPGCGDAEVGYETTDSGCDSDSYDDPTIDPGDDGGGSYDPDYDPYYDDSSGGCEGDTTDDGDTSSSSSGCEGTDDSSGTSSDGCDGGDNSSSSSSGCDDSGSSSSSSGCGDSGSSSSGCGSGCEGDTLGAAPHAERGTANAGGLGWIAIGMFVSALGVAARRRDDG